MAHKKKSEYRADRKQHAGSGWAHVMSGMNGSESSLMCFGVNLMDYPWEHTGQRATVCDPLHHEFHEFPVYAVRIKGKRREFAYGEYCMCIYGLYARRY